MHFYKSIISAILLFILPLSGRLHAQPAFYGGNGDGASVEKAMVTINGQSSHLFGGSSDGFALAIIQSTMNNQANYVSGGNADGQHVSIFQGFINKQFVYTGGGPGDGSSVKAASMLINDQAFYCSGGNGDGFHGVGSNVILNQQDLYCSSGNGDGFSQVSSFNFINGNAIYCFGGSGDGFSKAPPLLASLNNQGIYCQGGISDGFSYESFLGSMTNLLAFHGGSGDGSAGFFSGPLYLSRGLWTGLVSSDWNHPGNWNGLSIPTTETDVEIPTIPKGIHFPLQNNGPVAISKGLTLSPGASLTVPQGNSLAVLENFAIQSDADGLGSFIDDGPVSIGGNTSVSLFLTPDSWHYISSPISGALSGVFTGHYLYSFTESIDDWFNIVSTTLDLNSMQGYAAWVYDDPEVIQFQGPLHSGQYSIGVTRNTTMADQGWNLVGNPYPSSVDWDAPNGWIKNNVDNTIYFYQGAGGLDNYRYYIGETGESPSVGVNEGTHEIPSMQGFFVHASGTGSLTVNNEARIHSNQPYYKQTFSGEVPMVRIQISGGDRTDETVVRFVSEAGPNYDGKYDAYKLFLSDYPQIYTHTPDETQLVVNTLPALNEETVVPLGFIPTTETAYSIERTEFSDLSDIFLEDLCLGTFQKLNDNPVYSFTGNLSDDPNRFLLHFGMAVEPKPERESSLEIYSYGYSVFIKNKELLGGKASVFSIPGHEVATVIPLEGELTRINVLSGTGFYIVKVITGQTVTTQKVFIKN